MDKDEIIQSQLDGTEETASNQPFNPSQVSGLHLSLAKEGLIAIENGYTSFWVRLQGSITVLPGQDPAEIARDSYSFLSAQVNNMIAMERAHYEVQSPTEQPQPTGEW